MTSEASAMRAIGRPPARHATWVAARLVALSSIFVLITAHSDQAEMAGRGGSTNLGDPG